MFRHCSLCGGRLREDTVEVDGQPCVSRCGSWGCLVSPTDRWPGDWRTRSESGVAQRDSDGRRVTGDQKKLRDDVLGREAEVRLA